MKVFTAEQMRAFDRAATEQYGIPSIVLMENAALRVVEFLEMKFAPLSDKKIVVLCGKGNNGGDGLAIARHLVNAGCDVTVLFFGDSTSLKGDASVNFKIINNIAEIEELSFGRLRTYILDSVELFDEFGLDPSTIGSIFIQPPTHVIIDALLGTGFHGNIKEELLKRVRLSWGESNCWKVAVDIPSGLDANTGEEAPFSLPEDDDAVADFSGGENANYTITFAAPKRGMFLRDGLERCGEIWVGGIGTSPSLMEETKTSCECITREKAQSLLPRRPLDAHKGDAGRVVVCGGSYGMSGAPTLASRAVLRSGAGLCITCVPDRVLPMFAAAFSEATSHPLVCDEEGRLVEDAADAMAKHWESAHAVALGPGLSRSEGGLDFARRVVRECPHPLVIDADALYALRAIEEDVKQREAPTILTPHPGEMGELMEMETRDVQNDRIGVAVACAQRYNAIVVLKGARSIVALPNGNSYINLTGNSGMATGGSGDVLTGTIAGLLAQLKDAKQATLLGVYLHGLAGDLEYSEKGNGLIAGDIAEALPRALLKIQEPPEVSPNGRLRRLY